MKKIIEVGQKKVEVNYDARVNFGAIKIFVEDSIRDYRNGRICPVGYKGHKIVSHSNRH